MNPVGVGRAIWLISESIEIFTKFHKLIHAKTHLMNVGVGVVYCR